MGHLSICALPRSACSTCCHLGDSRRIKLQLSPPIVEENCSSLDLPRSETHTRRVLSLTSPHSISLTGTPPPTHLSAPSSFQLISSFSISLFGFRWALSDQRQRCPVCLHRVTHPARVGVASRTFLGWNGTEMMCMGGHHAPSCTELAHQLVQRAALALYWDDSLGLSFRRLRYLLNAQPLLNRETILPLDLLTATPRNNLLSCQQLI